MRCWGREELVDHVGGREGAQVVVVVAGLVEPVSAGRASLTTDGMTDGVAALDGVQVSGDGAGHQPASAVGQVQGGLLAAGAAVGEEAPVGGAGEHRW